MHSHNRCVTRDQIYEQIGLELPQNFDSFLCHDYYKKLKPNISRLLFPHEIGEFTILSPIVNSFKIICLAFNYSDQDSWIRFGKNPPTHPIIHIKPRTSLIGAYDEIRCPSFVNQLDYEGELALVIGKRGKNIKKEDALSHVAGYFILNDITAREIQFHDAQLIRAKGFDTFGPCGPWVTTSDEIADPNNLKLVTKVNGEVRQNSTTANLVLKVEEIISLLSENMTLEPCDVISTGTPSGTALSLSTQGNKFLHDGDVVEVQIPKLGKTKNTVKFENLN